MHSKTKARLGVDYKGNYGLPQTLLPMQTLGDYPWRFHIKPTRSIEVLALGGMSRLDKPFVVQGKSRTSELPLYQPEHILRFERCPGNDEETASTPLLGDAAREHSGSKVAVAFKPEGGDDIVRGGRGFGSERDFEVGGQPSRETCCRAGNAGGSNSIGSELAVKHGDGAVGLSSVVGGYAAVGGEAACVA